MKTLIAIDPGSKGGIAVCETSAYVEKIPDTFSDLAEMIRDIQKGSEGECIAYVEDIPKFCGPKLPGSVVFVMAENFGAIQGILAALRIRTIMVRPQEWQKGLGIGTKAACIGTTNNQKRTLWKRKLKEEAQRRFPSIKVTESVADALLILEWAKGQ